MTDDAVFQHAADYLMSHTDGYESDGLHINEDFGVALLSWHARMAAFEDQMDVITVKDIVMFVETYKLMHPHSQLLVWSGMTHPLSEELGTGNVTQTKRATIGKRTSS